MYWKKIAQTILAPYACNPLHSKGRLLPQAQDNDLRSPFQRDRDRIVHSSAFRRLKYKTQVFVDHGTGSYRTRLTHSLEVAQIARTLARSLFLSEDLAEAIALAHDLGHTPFGHAGEDALSEELQKYNLPPFNHNEQTLRIVTKLEQQYARFDGLNLTFETLEGILKHNGPLTGTYPETLKALDQSLLENPHHYASAESQIAAASDDIAYNNHDINDSLRAGILSLSDLKEVPLVGPLLFKIEKETPNLEKERLIFELNRCLITTMVMDLTKESNKRLKDLNPKSVEDIRKSQTPVIAYSQSMSSYNKELKSFLFSHVYRHYEVNRSTSKGRMIIQRLFTFYLEHPECLPPFWCAQIEKKEIIEKVRAVLDYLSGLQDHEAREQYHKLFTV